MHSKISVDAQCYATYISIANLDNYAHIIFLACIGDTDIVEYESTKMTIEILGMKEDFVTFVIYSFTSDAMMLYQKV